MSTQYYVASSLDGFIASSDDSLDWLFQFGSAGAASYGAFIGDVGAIAMGSATYEWILKHHIESSPESPGAWLYQQPTWVFSSRSQPAVPDADIEFVKGEVGPVHTKMVDAAAGKNVWLVGGGELVAQFHDAELLDELIVQVTPVVLGDGVPLLPREISDPPLRLVSSRTYGEALVELRYEVPRAD